MIKGLNDIYDISDKRSKSILYLIFTSIIRTLIFVLIIALGLIVLVFGESIILLIKNKFGIVYNYTWISWIFTQIGFIFIIGIVFLCIYKFIPKHKVSFKSQIPGALLGGIGLDLVSFLFSRYLDIFKGFSITYGSLTTLVLIMMWIYSCFYTLFLGAEVNKILNFNNKIKT